MLDKLAYPAMDRALLVLDVQTTCTINNALTSLTMSRYYIMALSLHHRWCTYLGLIVDGWPHAFVRSHETILNILLAIGTHIVFRTTIVIHLSSTLVHWYTRLLDRYPTLLAWRTDVKNNIVRSRPKPTAMFLLVSSGKSSVFDLLRER